jgi:tol-pal system protein YbgF
MGSFACGAAMALEQQREIPVIRIHDARVILNDAASSVPGENAGTTEPSYRAHPMNDASGQRSAPAYRPVLVETSEPNIYRTRREATAPQLNTQQSGATRIDAQLARSEQGAQSSQGSAGTGQLDAQNPIWELYNQVQALTEEVRQLRGMVESAQHTVRQLDRKQKQNYVDLDERVMELEGVGEPTVATVSETRPAGSSAADTEQENLQGDLSSGAASESGVPAASVATAPKAPVPTKPARPAKATPALEARVSEKQAYEKVYKLLQARELDRAKKGFGQFLTDYPGGQFAGSALYWLAELSLRQKSPDEKAALEYIERLIDDHPKHARIPDALYKQATLKYRGQEIEAAQRIFEQILNKHPGTTAARLADHQLKRIEGSL